ncbi:MAG: 2Fe-2S iron-sulfur cluster-binding protein [Mycetocola sp.]
MPEVEFTDYQGETRTIAANIGDHVMQLATRNGIPGIVGECGGVLSCATCHVFVEEDQLELLPPVGEMEDELLDGTAVDREPNSRLSCQIVVDGNIDRLCVRTPEAQD